LYLGKVRQGSKYSLQLTYNCIFNFLFKDRSSAPMADVSTAPSNVTAKMIVEMEVMNWIATICVNSIRHLRDLWKVLDSLKDILRSLIANGLWKLLRVILLFFR